MNYRLCLECKREFLQTYRQQVCCCDECRKARRLRIVREAVKRARARFSGLEEKRMNYRLCPECKREFLQTYRQQVCCCDECRKARRLRIVCEAVKRARARTNGGRGGPINGGRGGPINGGRGGPPPRPDGARAYADWLIAAKETRDAERQRLNERIAERARIAARLAAITAHPVAETVATREDGSRVIRRGNCPVASWM